MTLLAIIVVFFLMQNWAGVRTIQQDNWLIKWNTWFSGQAARFNIPIEITTLLIIALPACLAAIAYSAIRHIFWSLPGFAFLLVLLIYSLGRGDFNEQIQNYLTLWRNGDFNGAYHTALSFSHGELLEQTENPAQLHKHAVQAMLYQGFERWFSVIFWFVIAGPFGALVYRLSFILANQNGIPDQYCNTMVCRVIYWLEWLPVRLFGISTAVVGNFGSSIKVWRERLWHDEVSTEERLMHYGLAALGEDICLACQDCDENSDEQGLIIQGATQIEGLRSLLNRTVAFSVVVIALIVVFS